MKIKQKTFIILGIFYSITTIIDFFSYFFECYIWTIIEAMTKSCIILIIFSFILQLTFFKNIFCQINSLHKNDGSNIFGVILSV